MQRVRSEDPDSPEYCTQGIVSAYLLSVEENKTHSPPRARPLPFGRKSLKRGECVQVHTFILERAESVGKETV